jgi:hypothetical protein
MKSDLKKYATLLCSIFVECKIIRTLFTSISDLNLRGRKGSEMLLLEQSVFTVLKLEAFRKVDQKYLQGFEMWS